MRTASSRCGNLLPHGENNRLSPDRCLQPADNRCRVQHAQKADIGPLAGIGWSVRPRMRKFWWFPIYALTATGLLAGQSPPLSHVDQAALLTNAMAAKHMPVHVTATVAYLPSAQLGLFVLENDTGIYVMTHHPVELTPGDLVEITGVTRSSFRPIIDAASVRFLAHGSLPDPKPAGFADLIGFRWDCRYVQIDGRVLSASLDSSSPGHSMNLRIQMPLGTVDAIVARPGDLRPETLLDSEIRIAGVAGGEFDGEMQPGGVLLEVNSWREVAVLKPAKADPWQLPATPMDSVISFWRYRNQSQRVRITGTLTYYEPGSLAVLEHQGRSMLLTTNSVLPLHTGQGVEATGYPARINESIGLEDVQLRPSDQPPAAPAKAIDWESASVSGHTYDLVAMEGEVVGVLHDSRVDLFLLLSEGHLFSATLRHNSADAATKAGASTTPSIGSRIRVTGVCFVDAGNPWHDRLWLDLRLRSLNDVVVLQAPSWWTVKRMAYIVSALSIAILIAVLWVALLERRLSRQNAILARQNREDAIRDRSLAHLEQQRSHILERVNSSAPLPDVLREVQTVVSSHLSGAACWFELHPEGPNGVQIVRPARPGITYRELFTPAGDSLGFLLVMPLLQCAGEADIASTMEIGARLAELAINTRRHYGDLRHRSEYDLLTDIPNRFSLEKKLDELMPSASRNGAVFGLIYVDLDRFKQVNDQYGHRFGDLYLQEATRRMKMQLRNGDTLARIGGDEFIALVPILRTRADAELIAVRLERCFDEPFKLEGYCLHGAASIGLAVYPEDGASKEELQRAADFAMYTHKQEKSLHNSLAQESHPAA